MSLQYKWRYIHPCSMLGECDLDIGCDDWRDTCGIFLYTKLRDSLGYEGLGAYLASSPSDLASGDIDNLKRLLKNDRDCDNRAQKFLKRSRRL